MPVLWRHLVHGRRAFSGGERRMNRSPIVLTTPDAAYLRTPKCACTAIKQALFERYGHECRSCNLSEWSQNLPLIAMWRDPFDRIESAFRYFTQSTHRKYQATAPGLPRAIDWPGFVLGALMIPDDERNPHIRSQYRTACADYLDPIAVDFLPAEVLRWDFAAFARRFDLPDIPHLNASSTERVEWTPDDRRAVRLAFDSDFEIWEDV